MGHNRDFVRLPVLIGLGEPEVKVPRFLPFAFDMNARDGRYHVRAVRATLVLLPAARIEPGLPDKSREFPLTDLPLEITVCHPGGPRNTSRQKAPP